MVRYLVVWIALLALTALSLVLSLAHLGPVDVAVSLLIAAAKTALVLLFFMHLAEERFSVVMMPLVAVFFVALLLALLVTDVATRRTFPRAPLPNADLLPPGG
jgi:cytochrome c oxidase subunit 4